MKKIKIKRLAAISIIALVAVWIVVKLGIYLYSLIVGVTITDTGITITPSVVSEHDFEQYNGSMAVVNSKGVEFYDLKGNYESDVAFKLYSPYIYTCKKYAIVADINAQNAVVIKNKKQAYKITMDKPIQSVSINKNGYSAVLTEESGYKSTVVIYDNMGTEIFTWHSGDIFVVDVKVSDDNKQFAVVGIDVENELNSVAKLFKVNDDSYCREVILESELAYQLEYKGKNDVMVITDKNISVITKDGKIKNSYSFEGQNLLCFDIKNTQMPCIAFSNFEGAGSKVVVLNSSLKEKGSSLIDGQAKMMDENKKEMIVSNGEKVYLFNKKGKIKGEGVMLRQVDSIKLADDKKHIFTLSGSMLNVYKISVEKGGTK